MWCYRVCQSFVHAENIIWGFSSNPLLWITVTSQPLSINDISTCFTSDWVSASSEIGSTFCYRLLILDDTWFRLKLARLLSDSESLSSVNSLINWYRILCQTNMLIRIFANFLRRFDALILVALYAPNASCYCHFLVAGDNTYGSQK